uniref:40S ribosomal protein S6 n=1 Tax=Heterorhabditis bacteriophora TaxID=37862 RepID=A0A1I7WQP8_HETBA
MTLPGQMASGCQVAPEAVQHLKAFKIAPLTSQKGDGEEPRGKCLGPLEHWNKAPALESPEKPKKKTEKKTNQ